MRLRVAVPDQDQARRHAEESDARADREGVGITLGQCRRARLALLGQGMLMCGLGTSTPGNSGPFVTATSWRRFMAIVIDGLRAPGSAEMPPR